MSSKMAGKTLASLLCLGLLPHLHSAYITVVNDSTFPLIANIVNASGQQEAAINLSPGQSYIWQDQSSAYNGQPDKTTTPYTVRWVCNAGRPYDYTAHKKGGKAPPKYQSEFGAWDGVPASATVTAQGCTSGQKTCVIKKTQEQSTPSTPSRVHSKPPRHPNERKAGITNSGTGNFSNDGGMSWSNDGPAPYKNDDDSIADEKPSSEATVQ